MSLELQGEFLGLGSIVRLENESNAGLFVVLARGAFRPDNEQPEVEPRYLLAPHPYGEAPDQETFPIVTREIQEVVYKGYSDAADEAFLADLLDQMENGRRAISPAHQFTGSLTEIPDAREIQTDDSEEPQPGVDPFSVVRRLIADTSRKDEE
ncbi:DUF4176 domain-containing protein [Leifsonia lichenia]